MTCIFGVGNCKNPSWNLCIYGSCQIHCRCKLTEKEMMERTEKLRKKSDPKNICEVKGCKNLRSTKHTCKKHKLSDLNPIVKHALPSYPKVQVRLERGQHGEILRRWEEPIKVEKNPWGLSQKFEKKRGQIFNRNDFAKLDKDEEIE